MLEKRPFPRKAIAIAAPVKEALSGRGCARARPLTVVGKGGVAVCWASFNFMARGLSHECVHYVPKYFIKDACRERGGTSCLK